MISRNLLLYMILAFPFVVQGYLADIDDMEIIFIASKILSFCIVAIWYFLIHKKISKIMIMLILFLVFLFISTFANSDGSYLRYFQFCITILGFCMLTEIMLKDGLRAICLGIMVPASVFAVINLITILFYPDGLSLYRNGPRLMQYWLLGYYNAHILTLFPLMYLTLMYSYYTEEKINVIAIFVIMLVSVTVFIIWSASSVVAVTMFLIFIPILLNMKDGRIFNFRNYCIAAIICFMAIVVFRVQEYFMDVIEVVLRRSATLTGRGFKWDSYISFIQQKPFLGYGFESADTFAMKHGTTNAHNFYLEVLYMGGIVSLTLFIIMVIMAGRKLMKHKGNKLASILSFVFFVYAIRFIVESHMTNPRYIFMWFILAYHIDYIIIQQKEYMMICNERKELNLISQKIAEE